MLKRMMLLDLSKLELFDVYKKEIRSLLEYAAPVWHSSLSRNQNSEIKNIQKLVFKNTSYSRACQFFETTNLDQKRQDICHRFVVKNLKSDNSMFDVVKQDPRLRTRSTRVRE